MYSGIRSGKTFEALKVAHDTKSYILCFNETEKRRLIDLAATLNLKIRTPVTIEEMISSKMHTGFVKGLVIDNADMILERLFSKSEIHLITITNNAEQSKET